MPTTDADGQRPGVGQPKHPMHALTTFELARYRRELDRALKSLPAHAPVRAQLQQKLAQVIGEEEDRARIARNG